MNETALDCGIRKLLTYNLHSKKNVPTGISELSKIISFLKGFCSCSGLGNSCEEQAKKKYQI